jgi:hypothetical protein
VQIDPIHVCLIYRSTLVHFRFSGVMQVYPKQQSDNRLANPINHHRRKISSTCKWWRRSLKDENVRDSSTTYLKERYEQKSENKGVHTLNLTFKV